MGAPPGKRVRRIKFGLHSVRVWNSSAIDLTSLSYAHGLLFCHPPYRSRGDHIQSSFERPDQTFQRALHCAVGPLGMSVWMMIRSGFLLMLNQILGGVSKNIPELGRFHPIVDGDCESALTRAK